MMLGSTLRVTLIVVLIIYFAIILKLLKDKSLSLKYTLVWIFSGICMFILVLFPGLLLHMLRMLGIQGYMNGFFLFCIGFIMMILMSITSIVSRQNQKIRRLTQENALLEKRIRELEDKVNAYR
ncbi:DUF2304 domain-containing protein [Butyrivibrio sp. NC3005]|uniref:DUF2304 domain-containing protein n=1 Tax=Butyrivibrio sp. NC3005 TaxID=1280685 RepID=UPI0004209C9D|nr:DUF2304 domain-containing protein [Butyrivibrio sp. NC3005]